MGELATMLGEAFKTCVSDVFTLVGVVLPVALTLFTAKVGLVYAQKFFTKIAN